MRCLFWHQAGLQRSKTHWAMATSLTSIINEMTFPCLLTISNRLSPATLIQTVNEINRAQWDVYFGTRQVSRGQKLTELWQLPYCQMWIMFMAYPWSFENSKQIAHCCIDLSNDKNEKSLMRCLFWHQAGIQGSITHWDIVIFLPSNVDYVTGLPLVFWQFEADLPLTLWFE